MEEAFGDSGDDVDGTVASELSGVGDMGTTDGDVSEDVSNDVSDDVSDDMSSVTMAQLEMSDDVSDDMSSVTMAQLENTELTTSNGDLDDIDWDGLST